jgi:peptidoglycan hydrolase CwlO-like protein
MSELFDDIRRLNKEIDDLENKIENYKNQIKSFEKKDKPEYRNIYNDGYNAAIDDVLELLE